MRKIKGVLLSKQKVIPLDNGNVLHALKCSDESFKGFGEVYFSEIKSGAVKAWKRHKNMTMNFLVPIGSVRFILFEDTEQVSTNDYMSVELSRENYSRLTIPPMVWVGFTGISDQTSLIINIADIPHDPEEVDHLDKDAVDFEWI